MSGTEKQTAEKVLKALSDKPLRPRELVERLGSPDERLVRRVVWSLLDSGDVALRHDRKLEAAKAPTAAE